MAKKVTTYLERRKMEELMFAHSTPIAESDPNKRVWEDGWSHKRVAATIDAAVSPKASQYLAGMLGLTIQDNTPVDQSTRISALEDEIAKLCSRLLALEAWREDLEGIGDTKVTPIRK
jgi:hypothetical protein